MQETAQQYTQRLLGYLNGQDPLKVQKETAKKLAKLVKGLSKKQVGYARCDPKVSLENFRAVREANLSMLKALPKALWDNHGMHSERGKETITHVVRLIAGHDLNHLMQVEAIRKGGKAKRAA
jgi:hypothetical protein